MWKKTLALFCFITFLLVYIYRGAAAAYDQASEYETYFWLFLTIVSGYFFLKFWSKEHGGFLSGLGHVWRDYQERSIIDREKRARERTYLNMIRKEKITRESARLDARESWKEKQIAEREMWRDPFGVERSAKFWGWDSPAKKKKRHY